MPAEARDLDALRSQLGGLESRLVARLSPHELPLAEFRTYSQFGEDGIIQFLVQRVPIEHDVFVEFGVGDYREANTRFLLEHDNWRGLVIDGGTAHLEFLHSSELLWRHDLEARSEWVDRENIDSILRECGVEGDIGLLSIDLDGVDYWVLEAIEAVSPRIIIAEYNSTFGPDAAVTVPYDPRFIRADAHWSGMYWGASLAALTRLAERKGYALVGGNAAGFNAFFVRRDVLGDVPEVSVGDAYQVSRIRDSRGPDGELTYLARHEDRLRPVRDLPVVDIDSGKELPIAKRFGLT